MIVLVIVLIWVGYVTAEYFRVYRPDNTDNKVLISLGEKDTDTYV